MTPQKKIAHLQDIQMQIARFIDAHDWIEDKELVRHLRQAFTDLNSAKRVILDKAVADGTMKRIEPKVKE